MWRLVCTRFLRGYLICNHVGNCYGIFVEVCLSGATEKAKVPKKRECAGGFWGLEGFRGYWEEWV